MGGEQGDILRGKVINEDGGGLLDREEGVLLDRGVWWKDGFGETLGEGAGEEVILYIEA